MARDVSLVQIRTQVTDQGGYAGSRVFTAVVLNAWINRAIAEVYDLVQRSGEDYYTTDTALATVAGSDAVNLPSDFLKLISLGRQNGTRFRRLHRARMQDWTRWSGEQTRPTHYRLQGRQLRLLPTPDAIYALKLFYLPVAPTLVADTDTFDSIDYFDELVIAKVLLKCAARDERGLGDIEADVSRLEKAIRQRADGRDSGEPVYLEDLADDCEDDF